MENTVVVLEGGVLTASAHLTQLQLGGRRAETRSAGRRGSGSFNATPPPTARERHAEAHLQAECHALPGRGSAGLWGRNTCFSPPRQATPNTHKTNKSVLGDQQSTATTLKIEAPCCGNGETQQLSDMENLVVPGDGRKGG